MRHHRFHHRSDPATLVLLVNLGSPSEPTTAAVRRYLREFLSDKRVVELPRAVWWWILHLIILPFRSPRVARLYANIFTAAGAPLVTGTKTVAAKLAEQLDGKAEVAYAMCYGEPSIRSCLDSWSDKRLERLLILPLYPQYASSTTGAVFDQLARVMAHWRRVPDIRFIASYYDQQAYIDALARVISEKRKKDHLLVMSFHGLPRAMLEKGDPYYCHCHKTARLLADKLGLGAGDWRMTFQSRFGRQPWLQPYTDHTLRALPGEGVEKVQLVCPGFAVDCLETLEEIVVENRQLFLQAGGKSYDYIECLNSHPSHIALLAKLLSGQLACYRAEDTARLECRPEEGRQHAMYVAAAKELGIKAGTSQQDVC